jgi:hypothetical protein
MHVPYPFNGRVINRSNFSVRVWNDQKGIHRIFGGQSSSEYWDDIDYIEDSTGHWWKISYKSSSNGVVTVQPSGRLTGTYRRATVDELQYIMDQSEYSSNPNMG